MYPYPQSDSRQAGAARQWQPTYPPAAPPHWDTPPSAGYAHVVREWRKPSVLPYAGGWPQVPATPPPVKRHRRARWVGITAGVVVLAAVASAIVWWPHDTGETGTESLAAGASPSSQPVPVSSMEELLLSRAEAGNIFGSGPMGAGGEGRSDQVYSRMTPQRRVVDDDCNHGTPALSKDHEGSGWQAVRQQFLSTQNTDTAEDSRSLKQAVVNFPDATAARQFVDTSKAVWQQCANHSVNLKVAANTSDPNDYWNIGEVSETSDGIRMVFTQEGQDSWSCADSMTPVNNIVVELELCGLSPTKPVDDVLAQITEKIDAAK